MSKKSIFYLRVYLFFGLFIASRIAVASDEIKIVVRKDSVGSSTLVAKNSSYTPVTVVLYCILDNASANVSLPYIFVVDAQREVDILTIKKRDIHLKYGFKYYFHSQIGDCINAQHNDSTTYQLPFKSKRCVLIKQGYNGTFSHKGQKALDFELKIGSPVLSARDGIVIKTKQDSNNGCPDVQCSDQANKVFILHADGTIAKYLHFQYMGVTVIPGQYVNAGEVIGYSGNTGFSSIPHLHFEVIIPKLNNIFGEGVITSFFINKEKKRLSQGDCIK